MKGWRDGDKLISLVGTQLERGYVAKAKRFGGQRFRVGRIGTRVSSSRSTAELTDAFLRDLLFAPMQNAAPDWLREIDHTADVGIVVSAPDLAALYVRAARGMFWVLSDVESVRDRESTAVAVEAQDKEALMVQWLSELNFVHTTENWVFRRFEVDALMLPHDDEHELRLEATCYGEPIDRSRHTIYTEIKAVTFHDMTVTETNDSWEVQIIFDM